MFSQTVKFSNKLKLWKTIPTLCLIRLKSFLVISLFSKKILPWKLSNPFKHRKNVDFPLPLGPITVSYTHLDVYKRQGIYLAKKLSETLNIHLSMESKYQEFTKVILEFSLHKKM